MRTSAPNGTIPYLWDQNNDVFDHNQLVADWDAVDAALALPRTTNAITQVSALPLGLNNTTDRGKVFYLTSPDQSYSAGAVVKWIGTDFRNIHHIEILSTLPTLNNFDGRTVLLNASNGGFSAWTLVRYLTGSWYIVNQGIEAQSSLPSVGAYAGRVIILTSAAAPFNAYDVIRSDGASWKLVGPQPVPTATELSAFNQTTDLTTTNTSVPGDSIVTFGAATYENVKYYAHISIPRLTFSVAGTVNFLLYDVVGPTLIGNPISKSISVGGVYDDFTVWFPFTPSAGTHTYNIRWYINTAGTATINTTGLAPAIFRITKA